MELLELENKIKNDIEVSKIKQNVLEDFLKELQKINNKESPNNLGNNLEIRRNNTKNNDIKIGDRENMLEKEFRKEGEIYEVDEIGDDEKYVFLTRLSDKAQMQEFNISNELYNELLNDKSEELRVIYKNGEYKIIWKTIDKCLCNVI